MHCKPNSILLMHSVGTRNFWFMDTPAPVGEIRKPEYFLRAAMILTDGDYIKIEAYERAAGDAPGTFHLFELRVHHVDAPGGQVLTTLVGEVTDVPEWSEEGEAEAAPSEPVETASGPWQVKRGFGVYKAVNAETTEVIEFKTKGDAAAECELRNAMPEAAAA